MAYRFAQASKARYTAGGLFLGTDPDTGQEVGLETERHAITIAGTRSGKGAALIIPNLLKWPHNALVIDPKGENAELTWEDREAMGQKIAVLDPFKIADIPDRLRVTVDLLDGINPQDRNASRYISEIASGLVIRHDPKHATWDNPTVALLAGLIAYVVQSCPPEHRNLAAIRKVIMQPENPPQKTSEGIISPENGMWFDANDMLKYASCDMLTHNAGLKILKALETQDNTLPRQVLEQAQTLTAWLDMEAFQSVLGQPTLGQTAFSLNELKQGKATLYLVLPPDAIPKYPEFLGVFARAALDVMLRGGNRKGEKCLFILDEFYSLGRLEQISKGTGLMASYGVTLWPFMQEIGQLFDLYGNNMGHSFFGGSDAQIFMGNTDAPTLSYISQRLGTINLEEVSAPPERPMAWTSSKPSAFCNLLNAWQEADYTNKMNSYQHDRTNLGRPRMTESEIREFVKKATPKEPSRSMIVIGQGDDIFHVHLKPHFDKKPTISPASPSHPTVTGETEWVSHLKAAGAWFLAYYITTQIVPRGMPELISLAVLAFYGWCLWKGGRHAYLAWEGWDISRLSHADISEPTLADRLAAKLKRGEISQEIYDKLMQRLRKAAPAA